MGVAPSKKVAEQNAAKIACEAIGPALQMGNMTWAPAATQGWAQGKDAMMMQWMTKGKGKGKGKSFPSGADLPRQRITQVPVTGEVLEWKGKFGWVKPHTPIEHALAAKRGGKLFLSNKDIP